MTECEETIARKMIENINSKEVRKIFETAPKDKINLNKENEGYRLIVGTVPAQTSLYMSAETISRSEENKTNNGEYIRQKFENRKIAEVETMLRNSQYNWMKVEKTLDKDKWQIRDKRNGKVRFIGTPQKVIETVKEITQNQ